MMRPGRVRSVAVATARATSPGSSRARPKSRSLAPWGVRKMFEGLRSRCTTPASCRAPRAASRSSATSIASAGDSGSRRSRAARVSPGQQLHGEKRPPALLADLEDGAHVGMADPCRGAGLAEKPAPRGPVPALQGLQRDLPAQGVVRGEEDTTHASLADLLEDAVAPDARGERRRRRLGPAEQPPEEPPPRGTRGGPLVAFAPPAHVSVSPPAGSGDRRGGRPRSGATSGVPGFSGE